MYNFKAAMILLSFSLGKPITHILTNKCIKLATTLCYRRFSVAHIRNEHQYPSMGTFLPLNVFALQH